jgi:hypothetical protein
MYVYLDKKSTTLMQKCTSVEEAATQNQQTNSLHIWGKIIWS